MFAAAMVSAGKADVCIAGNLSSTANVLRAGLRIIGLQHGCKTLSSIFLMLPQYLGPSLGFADCSVVPQPTAAQLADIAIASAQTWQAITGEEPRVAMLSFSSNGSARHPNVANVQQATEIVRERARSLPWTENCNLMPPLFRMSQRKSARQSVKGQCQCDGLPIAGGEQYWLQNRSASGRVSRSRSVDSRACRTAS